jgi:Leucine-rich repeat (LRR) protein
MNMMKLLMKSISKINSGNRFAAAFCITILLLIAQASGAQDISPDEEVRIFAGKFLAEKSILTKGKSAVPELNLEYRSSDTVLNRVWCFSSSDEGFVLAALRGDKFVVVGYSLKGRFTSGTIHSSARNLISYFEKAESLETVQHQISSKGTVVVAPLLQREGVSLTQYLHSEAGGCWSGCTATAMAQIMSYYKFPSRGIGSACYTHPVYGQLCADFANTTYNWTSMTAADYELLSFHLGIGMKMNYCGSPDGSIPSDQDYKKVLQKHFGYQVTPGSAELYYIYKELDNERPVYCELPGSPGHAVVLDGYDSDGLLHISFGWGGSSDGYYMLNTSSLLGVPYSLHSNISGISFISPVPLWTNSADSLALVAFHNSMKGKTGWDLAKPVITWPGVLVVNGRVAEIKILNNNLEGVIPESFGTLTELRRLNIKGLIHSPLPASLTQLTKLKELVIKGVETSVKGPMPADIGNLVMLEDLRMTGLLNGTISGSIGNLVKLKYLDLSLGGLSGSIPSGLYNLTALETLILQKNKLTGTISPQIGQLTKLKYMSLWTNQMEGTLPEQIGNLTDIREFDISFNSFSGQVPETIGSWTAVTRFSVSDNLLEGALPHAVTGFSQLTGLKISNNKFTSLPDSIGRLVNLQTLEANNNLLDSIPSSVSKLAKLYMLALMNNRLTTLPDLGSMPALWDLQLSYNKINRLPEKFGNLIKVRDLYLGNNELTDLPSSFENLSTLRKLALTGNKLTSVPSAFCFLSGLKELSINNNEISRPLPPLKHLGITYLDIRNNKLIFSDIASSLMPDDTIFTEADNYVFDYHDQSKVELTDSVFIFAVGDSAGIDIRSITRLSHPQNTYEWYRGSDLVQKGPVLSFPDIRTDNEGAYYCKVRNKKYSKVLVLETDPLTLQTGSGTRVPEGFLVSTRETDKSKFTDNLVTLITPSGLRGAVVWQASADSVTWHNLTSGLDEPEIEKNIISADTGMVVIEPKSSLMFRYVVTEDDCDPVISDTVRIASYGKLLLDTMLNVRNKEVTITADSIEIVFPPDFTDEDFRLTIKKLDSPPAAPDTVSAGTVYDVNVSCGSVFETPLLIRLKNIDKSAFDSKNIDKYRAVYFDDLKQEWVPYENSMISLSDTSVVFGTNHLTKLSWWFDPEAKWGYTDVYVRNNIKVFYKQSDMNSFIYLYGKSQSAQPWHVSGGDPEYGTPVMIQDITQYLYEVMNKYRSEGLTVPDHDFSVFVKEMDDYGNVGMMGLLNHYMNINREIDTPEQLRSVLAHEFMHYTQDDYISAHAGNIFWMEAHAPLSDRFVWDKTVIPLSESDSYLLDGREGKYNIFSFLAKPWDYWDRNILTQNALGDVHFCYLASTFLHYMRSYKEGDKLSPSVLLKETPYLQSWLEYLDSYIARYLNSNVGDQYDAFVKYIVEGTNPDFSLISHKEDEDPLKYIKLASTDFMTDKYYKSGDDPENNLIQDSILLEMPYLSSKMVQMFNLNSDHKKVIARYKRKSEKKETMKVYLGRFDSGNNKIVLEDISAIDSGFFFIDSPTGENLVNKKHIAWLLFINKDKGEDYKLNYEVEVSAIPEISYFDGFVFWTGSTAVNAPIHVLIEGTTEIQEKIPMIPLVYRYFGEEVYNSSMNINSTITETEIISQSSSAYAEQTFRYNFVTGEIYVHQKENWGGLDPDDVIDIREMTLVFKNVKNIKPEPPGGQSRFLFSTSNTSQTKDIVESITYTRQYALYDKEKMEHNPIVTTTYLRTNYEDAQGNDLGVKLFLQFY